MVFGLGGMGGLCILVVLMVGVGLLCSCGCWLLLGCHAIIVTGVVGAIIDLFFLRTVLNLEQQK